MKHFLTLLILMMTLLPSDPELWAGEKADEIVKNACAVLNQYHRENPQPGDRKLHIICWRPTDRDYAIDYRSRLTRIMTHIQAFYGDEMERMGFGRRSIQLDYNAEGKLVINEAIGDSPFADYSKPEGQRIKQDCWPVLKAAGLNPDKETVLIFTNLSDWDPVKNTFVHKSPYYAGGGNRNGLAWQLDSPELDTENLPLKEPMIQDGEYGRISLGKHNSIFIGGIAHELGHALGLPHCRARDDEAALFGTALMGSGNRTYGDELRGEGKGTFLTLAHALRLASHPQFSGSIKGLNLPAKAQFHSLAVSPRGEGFSISGAADSPVPIYAIIAYLDPEGGGDYDSRTVATVPDRDGRFTIECDALVRGKRGDLRIVACLANGATSTWQGRYMVSKSGAVDVSAMQTALELGEFTAALNSGNTSGAKAISEAFPPESRNYRISAAILEGRKPDRNTVSSANVPGEMKTYPLSRISPQSEMVGWQKPAYDHVPREDPLLISGGQLFETGIYAHAESRHVYDLEKGGWKYLEGSCGLPNQRGGSVVFVIRTDGKEKYRSRKVLPGQAEKYRIDLSGVSELELITEDAGDGKAVDWGMWFEPKLTR